MESSAVYILNLLKFEFEEILFKYIDYNSHNDRETTLNEFQNIVMKGTYILTLYMLLKHNHGSYRNEYEQIARDYADTIPVYAENTIRQTYNYYRSGAGPYKEALFVAIDTLTDFFCITNGITPPDNNVRIKKVLHLAKPQQS